MLNIPVKKIMTLFQSNESLDNKPPSELTTSETGLDYISGYCLSANVDFSKAIQRSIREAVHAK